MKKPVFKSLLLAILCSWTLISCQNEFSNEVKKKDTKVQIVDELHKDIKLNIHVRHFHEKGQQGVSPWVYSLVVKSERKKYYLNKEFRRHHNFNDLKTNLCDNTVRTTDRETEKIIFMCGGHTSTQR
jgi:hypothetical protein